MAATPASARVEDYGPRPGMLVPQPAPERGVACVLAASPDGKFLAYGNGTSVIIRSIDVSRRDNTLFIVFLVTLSLIIVLCSRP